MASDFQRVRQLFEMAVELPRDDQVALLRRECGDDDDTRAEVEQLLRCDTRSCELGGMLDRGPDLLLTGKSPKVGGRIDAFALCSVLGSGGMGTVYEAEQDEPRRRVALKVLSLGLASEQAVRRFRWEAETLARLRHPNIAQVHAVGVHRSGDIELPWFAMELVPGARDLLSYAKAHELSLRERIELLLQVCDAVHYGHLQGVVHRDLKPQNVLVDVDGRVKVIDFGIARSMAGDAGGITEQGVAVGTLHYMSPEQLLRGGDVDLRSDIYSLGVVAFELIAGRRPFVFDETTPMVVAETVTKHDAPRLSTVARGVEKDLEVVVQKALRREVDERYASVREFAEDLRAYLDERPVRARAPSTFYQVRMFARRRRGLVASLGVIFGMLVTGLSMVLYQNGELEARGVELSEKNTALADSEALLGRKNDDLARAVRELESKNVELERRQRVSSRLAQFAKEFLDSASLTSTRGLDYTVREALDVAAARIEDETFEDPAVEAELRLLIGETYTSLTLAQQAEHHLERAVALFGGVDGAVSRRVAAATTSLAICLREQGRNDDAMAAIDAAAAAFGPAHEGEELWWRIQHNRAYVLRHLGRLEDALALFRRVVAARERLLGENDQATVISMHNLGTLLLALRRPEDARDVLADAVARAEADPDHPRASTLQIQDNLAEAWRDLGELDRAAAMHRATMAEFEQVVGPDHQVTIGCGYHLLKVLYAQRDVDGLEQLARELRERCRRAFGPTDYRTMDVTQALAAALFLRGDVDEAVRLQRESLRNIRDERGPAHPDTVNAGNNLMQALLRAGDHAGALLVADGLCADALDDDDAVAQMPPQHVGLALLLRAQALVGLDRRADARACVARAAAHLEGALPAEHPVRRQADALRAELARD